MMQQCKYVPYRDAYKPLAALKAASKIRRVGPARGGHWEVIG